MDKGTDAAVGTLDNIKSITYNDTTGRQKGEELTNYTQNYNTNKEVTTTAVYFYGTSRASAAAAEALNTQINTYRLGSGTGAAVDTMADIKSITYNDVAGRQKGEELTNYTANYNSVGQVTSTAVYFYASGSDIVRAVSAGAAALNSQVNTYRNNYIGATAATLANIKSITYNDITDRQKGEELTKYTQN